MDFQAFREKVNLYLYNSKDRNLSILRLLSFFASLIALGAIVYYFGFAVTFESRIILFRTIKLVFLFYLLDYIIRVLYDYNPIQFIKETWIEAVIFALLIADTFTYIVFRFPVVQQLFSGITFYLDLDFWILFISLHLLLVGSIDIGNATRQLSRLNFTPSTLFIFSFVLLIFIGTGLLMLPEMTTSGNGAGFIEALFTSTSASCVTGLIVVDTATYFTFKGHLVILVLIKLGGLSIISFATFFATLAGSGIGIRHQSYMKEMLSAESLLSTKGLLSQIIFMSLAIESAGALLCYFLWNPELHFTDTGQKVFFSVFHAVSAFNNAGFSLFTNGLYEDNVRTSYILHLVIATLVFFGGLGFIAIRDLFGIKNLRERIRLPWKQVRLTTKIALYMSVTLVIAGTIAFYLLERQNTLTGLRFMEALITSLFQSVITRTAGFNTIDITALAAPTLIFIILLMFIGGSSGSTAGGIKTSTFTLLILSAISTIRGKKTLELGHYSISNELLNRAFSVAFFASGIVFAGSFILSITDPQFTILQLAFEEVSAFATTGLSTGITAGLSVPGKIVVIVTMFVGRIGPLTLAFALSTRAVSSSYKYPSAHVMVG